MKAKEYQKRKDENLAQWVDRLAADVMWNRIEPETIHDILSEVSVTSYIEGVRADREVSAKFGGVSNEDRPIPRNIDEATAAA